MYEQDLGERFAVDGFNRNDLVRSFMDPSLKLMPEAEPALLKAGGIASIVLT